MRYNIPCLIDGIRFETIIQAYDYLMQVNGRVHLDRLERYLRQGRRIFEGHIISRIETRKNNDSLSL
jgi:hypothetical protein